MKICPDCGESLVKVADRLYYCEISKLYYPVSTRGEIGYPLTKPPASMMQPKEPPKKVVPTPDMRRSPMTDREMFSHPKFFQFCLRQYSELSPIEAIHQIKNSDPETKRIVRTDFFNWLET